MPPLFFKKNLEKSKDMYYFDIIITRVYESVRECCRRLKLTATEVCSKHGLSLPELCESPVVYENPEKNIRQFHGERLIFVHLGYINEYRMYIVHDEQISVEERICINMILTNHIKNYLLLYGNGICCQTRVNEASYNYLLHCTRVVEESEYTDFETSIKTR